MIPTNFSGFSFLPKPISFKGSSIFLNSKPIPIRELDPNDLVSPPELKGSKGIPLQQLDLPKGAVPKDYQAF